MSVKQTPGTSTHVSSSTTPATTLPRFIWTPWISPALQCLCYKLCYLFPWLSRWSIQVGSEGLHGTSLHLSILSWIWKQPASGSLS
jgi:hypothetical protein